MSLPTSIEMRPCTAEVDGTFIRNLTRENFYDLFERTIGWDEAKAREQPAPPRRYHIVMRAGERIGFFALLDEGTYRYLVTIQLVPAMRGCGLGTELMRHIEAEAQAHRCEGVRLRVFNENRARSLYDRLGYEPIRSDAWSQTLEKRFETDSKPSE